MISRIHTAWDTLTHVGNFLANTSDGHFVVAFAVIAIVAAGLVFAD